MAKKQRFPLIHVNKSIGTDTYDAVGALELKSILHARLLVEEHETDGTAENMDRSRTIYRRRQCREGLLHALSPWPSRVCVELRVAALPSISSPPNGRLSIHMLIRARDKDEAKARESVAAHCLSLYPILRSHIPEAEFVPVSDPARLKRVLYPFRMTHALFIGRVKQNLSLSTPLKKLSIGFGDLKERPAEEPNHMVDHVFPWRPSREDWGPFLHTMMGGMEPMLFLARVSPRTPDPGTLNCLRTTVETCEAFLTGSKDQNRILKRQARMIRDCSVRQLAELNTCSFHVGVFVLADHAPDEAVAHVLGRRISSYSSDEDANLFEGGFSIRKADCKAALMPVGEDAPGDYTLTEAACAFRLPDPPQEDIPGLPVRRSRTGLAVFPRPARTPESDIGLFTNAHAGTDQEVSGTEQDRLRHFFIIGQTGTGKSTLMEHMILQDIHGGRGVAVIDPHGDLVEQLLGKIPKRREKDVIYFNMLDRERPLGFNVLEWHKPEEQNWIIDELYLTLDRIYNMKDVGGPMFENNFRGMLKLLTGAKEDGGYIPTLLEFTRCYQERRFRKWLKNRTTDPQVLDFVEELENTGGEGHLDNISPYITSKFTRFVQDSTLRRIIGQEKSGFDFEDAMTHGKILLVNLGKGRFGPNVSALVANQMVSRFKHAAMKRGEMTPEERVPFYVYVDECHNLPPENFSELLSEARKYRMGLVLATQYAGQIKNDSQPLDLLTAVLGNVGTIIIFRLGYNDALKMSQILYPNFSAHDIIGLPNYEGYVRMQYDGQAVSPFSFQTEVDPTPYSKKTAERVRRMSQRRYGCDAEEVEKAILKRRTVWKGGEGQPGLFENFEDEDEG